MTGRKGEKMIDYQRLADFYGNEMHSWIRFRSCQAWITEFDIYNSAYGVYFGMVKSYNTIVAIVDHSRKKFIRLGKWSRTTSKQSTQIHNVLYPDYEDIQL